ncbi:MAG: Trk system potassium transporter TrkA [Methanomassiliicoccales archaeon]
MQVVVIGAGNVGFAIARAFSNRHSVSVIENDERRFEYVVNSLDVGAINGNGASPKVLQQAITKKTDLFLAVTDRDETNIFACLVAKMISPKLITVARIKNPEYSEDLRASELIGVDHIISPEYSTAVKMFRIALLENVIDYESIPHLGIAMARFRVTNGSKSSFPLPIWKLDLPEEARMLIIHRGKEIIMPWEHQMLKPGDKVTVIGSKQGIMAFDALVGRANRPKNFIIVGGGVVGEYLVGMMEREKLSVKVIEKNEDRCNALAKRFNNALIINDEGSDPLVLRAENVSMFDALICTTDREESNLLASLVGKHLGVPKVITRYAEEEYEEIFNMTGIDASIGGFNVAVNDIVKKTVPEYEVMLLLEAFSEEFFSITVGSKCRLKGKKVGDIVLPDRSIIAIVVKEGNVIFPEKGTVIAEGDRVLIYAHSMDIPKLERIFKASIPVGP